MKISEFLQKIQESYNRDYSNEQAEVLAKVLSSCNIQARSMALEKLLLQCKYLPTVAEVNEVCSRLQGELMSDPALNVKGLRHNYTSRDFGVRPDTFNAWFSELAIEARGAKLFVKVPKLIHQHWIADNHEGLMRSLLRPFKQNGIMDVVFVFVSEAGNRIETEVDVTEFTGVKRPPVELLAKGNQSSEVRV